MAGVAFIQFSDTHIGKLVKGNKLRKPNWRGLFLSGFNPHDDRLLEPLRNSFRAAKSLAMPGRRRPLRMVFVGDLTAGGTDNDYALAQGLLFRRWQWSHGKARSAYIGFGCNPRDVLMVPGNHDHWKSNYFQRGYSSITPRFFSPTPWLRQLVPPSNDLVVQFFGIDSSAGWIGSNTNWAFWAEGRLADSDVVQLDHLLQAAAAKQMAGFVYVRVIVCHHSFAWNQNPATDPRPLSDEGRRLLLYLAAKHKVSVILTGHAHDPLDRPWPMEAHLLANLNAAFQRLQWNNHAAYDPTWRLHEFRSRAALAGVTGPGNHGYLVHAVERIAADATRVSWSNYAFDSNGTSFQCQSRNPSPVALRVT